MPYSLDMEISEYMRQMWEGSLSAEQLLDGSLVESGSGGPGNIEFLNGGRAPDAPAYAAARFAGEIVCVGGEDALDARLHLRNELVKRSHMLANDN